ncbi:tripartite tricarboxylate transporter TctB family protein [Thermodesulfobacteriota bacterium]
MSLGGFTLWQSEKLTLGNLRAPGPGFFPFCLGFILIGVALIILVQGLKRKTVLGYKEQRSHIRVILALAGIFAYSLTFEFLGYLLSTYFLMFLLIKMMVKKTWWFVPSISGVVALFSYILFKVFLKVLLPRGILSF